MINPVLIFLMLFNILKFKILNVRYGRKLRVRGVVNIKISKGAEIVVGDNFTLVSGGMYNSIGRNIKSCMRSDESAKIIIGNNVGVSNVCIWAKSLIQIGDFVKIGADSIIVDSDMHSLDFMQRRSSTTDSINAKKKAVIIGDDVFIGTRSIICKGTVIGDRSIIGAGSVVSGVIPSDEIWAGNPARFIKKLGA
jgi:acetyltransferase-like isoleucine patch superfamily enzyme